jgi:hypothetical protein
LVPGNTLQRNSASSLPVFLEMDFHQALTNSLWLCSSGKIGVSNNPHKCWLYHGSPLLIQLVKRVLAVHVSRELLFYISCSVSQTTQVLHFSSQKVLGIDGVTWGGIQQRFFQYVQMKGFTASECLKSKMYSCWCMCEERIEDHKSIQSREEDIQSTTPYHTHGTRFNSFLLHSCARKDPV